MTKSDNSDIFLDLLKRVRKRMYSQKSIQHKLESWFDGFLVSTDRTDEEIILKGVNSKIKEIEDKDKG